MGKVIKLNESDIQRIVKRVLREQSQGEKEVDEWEKNYRLPDEDPDVVYHRSRYTDDDDEYEWANDAWGKLQNPTDNRSYEDEEGFEEVASFDDYDEYIKSGYCHPHDTSCMKHRTYFDRRKDMLGDLKISRRHKKR